MSDEAKRAMQQRINRITTYKIKKKLKKFLKKFFKVIFTFLKYIILFVILCLLSSYDFYDNSRLNGWLVVWFYLWVIMIHKDNKINYKSWQDKGKYSEFDKRFCELWQPSIIGFLFCFWIGLKFCNNFEFILIMFIPYCYDLWTRRYLTTDIKQDLILKELQKKSEKENSNYKYFDDYN